MRVVGRVAAAALTVSVVCCAAPTSLLAADTLPEPVVDRKVATSDDTVILVRRSTKEAPIEIGGYRVAGALSYAFGRDGQGNYTPPVIAAKPGESLRFKLVNDIDSAPWNVSAHDIELSPHTDPTDLNIHTHGLVTSPCGGARQGDNVLVTITSQARQGGDGAPMGHHAGHHGMPAEAASGGEAVEPGVANACGAAQLTTVKGSADYQIKVKDDGASGLYWFHPHIHGFSHNQVNAGLSGVIDVGSLCDSQHLMPDDQSRLCKNGKPQLRSRIIMLKDIELSKFDEKNHTAVLRSYTDFEKCSDQDKPYNYKKLQGYCYLKNTKDKYIDRWMFTLNGALYPTIELAPGEQQIWRIANIGAMVPYYLALKREDGRTAEFQVINVDGNYLAGSVTLQALYIMPGTRADIVVSSGTVDAKGRLQPFKKDVEYQLIQRGVDAGSSLYPAIALAKVVMRGDPEAKAADAPAVIGLDPKPAEARLAMIEPQRALTAGTKHLRPSVCRNKGGSGNPTVVFADGTVISPDRNSGVSTGNLGFVPMRMGNTADFTKFYINTNGQGSRAFDMDRVDLCVEKDATVRFQIKNATDEFHNFHIHQTRFYIEDLEYPASGPDDRPNHVLDGFFKDVTVDGAKVPVERDTAPVPIFGSVTVKIQFPEAGRFVYHCHVLTHEDHGMMQIVEVFEGD